MVIPLVHEYVRKYRPLKGGATDRENFTSDLEATEQASVSSDSTEEAFVIMIIDESPNMSPSEEELIDAKLTPLNRRSCRALMN